ncbi:MAG: DUF2975 domain-containing protein [Hyphomonas sp.]|jgi:DUF2975 family protein|nr:DUF2975 domain-containing protein [Henriciella sp.]MBO6695931.1 DUF2975 domain-containing protein [Henriciella sp.]MCR9223421.1 DUF2975 domain-containing protein [Hyphomonas sp.]
MSEPRKNSMAAFLSTVVTVIFWLAIVLGGFLFIILSIGLLGSLNGGEIDLPLVEARADGVPAGRLVAALVGLVVFAPGIAYICSKLRQILSTLAAGDPFVPENAPRLTRIAIAIGLIEVIRMCSVLVLAATVDLGEGYVANININLAVWGAIIVLLILAQVFKEGTRLREEEKMTI